jgi:hypothetical protein
VLQGADQQNWQREGAEKKKRMRDPGSMTKTGLNIKQIYSLTGHASWSPHSKRHWESSPFFLASVMAQWQEVPSRVLYLSLQL